MEVTLLVLIGATSFCSLLLSVYQIVRGPRIIYIVSEPEPEPEPMPEPRRFPRALLLMGLPVLLLLLYAMFGGAGDLLLAAL